MKLRDKDMESKKIELTNDEYELILRFLNYKIDF